MAFYYRTKTQINSIIVCNKKKIEKHSRIEHEEALIVYTFFKIFEIRNIWYKFVACMGRAEELCINIF